VRDALLRHRIIAVTQQSDYVLCRDLGTVTLRNLADIVGVQSQMPGVSDYLQTFEWFPEVAARLLSIDQHVEVQFDVPLTDIFQTLSPVVEPYPDEGEGLEMLHSELASYQTLAGGTASSEAAAVFTEHEKHRGAGAITQEGVLPDGDATPAAGTVIAEASFTETGGPSLGTEGSSLEADVAKIDAEGSPAESAEDPLNKRSS
jgi:hypothetical protein